MILDRKHFSFLVQMIDRGHLNEVGGYAVARFLDNFETLNVWHPHFIDLISKKNRMRDWAKSLYGTWAPFLGGNPRVYRTLISCQTYHSFPSGDKRKLCSKLVRSSFTPPLPPLASGTIAAASATNDHS